MKLAKDIFGFMTFLMVSVMIFISACEKMPSCDKVPRHGETLQMGNNVKLLEDNDKYEKYLWTCGGVGHNAAIWNYWITTDHDRKILSIWTD